MEIVVIGYDASEAADRALERRRLAREGVRGAARRHERRAGARRQPPRCGTLRQDNPELHERDLERAKEKLAAAGIAAEYVNAVGDPASAILDLAEERAADLIVVGTREPNILKRMLGLSVSGTVSRQAHCDVLVVH